MQVNAPTAVLCSCGVVSCLGGWQTEGVDSDEESDIDWRIENETKGSR